MKYNGKIISVMVCVSLMFLSLAGYLTYFTLFEGKDVSDNKFNKRIREREEQVLRGTIYDSNGEILAYSSMAPSGQVRHYPFKERYAHVVGYNSVTYDKSALEYSFNDKMTQSNPIEDLSNAFSNSEKKSRGADLYLTIDNNLTGLAESLMEGKNGAVVALVPDTGAVLCMYSNPTFDPNEEALRESFESLTESENAPFVARCTQGLYAPGSTFKIITAIAALEEGCATVVEDTGSKVIDGYEVTNYENKALGLIELKEGFSASSNVMFASYGVAVGEDKLKSVAKRFGIGEKLNFDILTSKSYFTYDHPMGQTDLAAVGIGQGKLLVTPLNMALVAAAIGNDGVMMTPYMVEKASFGSVRNVYSHKAEVWKNSVDANTAQIIEDCMIDCVENGTGKGAKIENVTVAGKTGTAENEKEGKEHAWFICYAPAENPEIAICVMQEYTGLTGSSCAPVAKKLIEYYLKG